MTGEYFLNFDLENVNTEEEYIKLHYPDLWEKIEFEHLAKELEEDEKKHETRI